MPAVSPNASNSPATTESMGTLHPVDLLWQGPGQLPWWQVEKSLRSQGFTLGWLPMSGEQQSLADVLVKQRVSWKTAPFAEPLAGCQAVHLQLPDGRRLSTRNVPRSAAGPDLKQLFLGGQGTPSWIEQVTLRVLRLPTGQETLHFSGTGGLLEQQRQALQLLSDCLHQGAMPTSGVMLWGQRSASEPEAVAVVLHVEGEQRLVQARTHIAQRRAQALSLHEQPSGWARHWLYQLEKQLIPSLEPWLPLEAHGTPEGELLAPPPFFPLGWKERSQFCTWQQWEQRRKARVLPARGLCWGVRHEGGWCTALDSVAEQPSLPANPAQARAQEVMRLALEQVLKGRLA